MCQFVPNREIQFKSKYIFNITVCQSIHISTTIQDILIESSYKVFFYNYSYYVILRDDLQGGKKRKESLCAIFIYYREHNYHDCYKGWAKTEEPIRLI